MAFDGSIIACIVDELNKTILDGRIVKIAQPEKDELLFTIKKDGNQFRLLMDASPSLPIVYLTEYNQTAPLQAPAFCMLLRKHILNGRIVSISQPSLERIIDIEVDHFNEMGDICHKILTIELMGKHSNIIFRDGTKILDSIKHISALISSVREVFPGKEYFIPFENDKKNPIDFISQNSQLEQEFFNQKTTVSKAIYSSFTGISPIMAEEISYVASIDSDRPVSSLDAPEQEKLNSAFYQILNIIKDRQFQPNIVYENDVPSFFGAFDFSLYRNKKKEFYESISSLLYDYYAKKQKYTTIRQKTSDLRQVVQTLLNKDYKKYDLQLKQMKDTEKKEKYQLYGELITAYGYNVPAKSTSMTAINYHTNEEITIPLDPTLTAIENGKKYFDKYSKLKRTFDALSEIIKETKDEIDHLESISVSLSSAVNEADISEIKREMIESGYIKNKGTSKGQNPKKAIKSKPLHFISTDGFDIYVGKNNYQNEYLSFKLAENS
ncbi:MAG: NFACT family protein, partial [Lachnospiraceae bacterium]|nr:NFACT family protein [Lachnospiraceae bacterium]